MEQIIFLQMFRQLSVYRKQGFYSVEIQKAPFPNGMKAAERG